MGTFDWKCTVVCFCMFTRNDIDFKTIPFNFENLVSDLFGQFQRFPKTFRKTSKNVIYFNIFQDLEIEFIFLHCCVKFSM